MAKLIELILSEPDAKVAVFKALQFENAPVPIDVMELGIVIDVKLVQYLNAKSPIVVTRLPFIVLGITNGPAYVDVINDVIVTLPATSKEY